MLALEHAPLHPPLPPLNTPAASLPTPNAETASPASPLAPDSAPLVTSSGISPVTVEFPGLAKRFKVSDQQAFIVQHEDLRLAMQRLHSQQPSFKTFMQPPPGNASADVTAPNPGQYAAAVQAFWTTPRPTERKPNVLQTPLDQLLALHKQQLSTLAALRVSDGTLSAAGKQLIDAALQYPTLAERETAFADGARPGVYPLTLDDGTERGALLAGTFLITKTDGSWATKPTWTDARNIALNDANGPVVLYTPGEGFEEFATPAQARQALATRLDEGGVNAELLLQTLPLSVQHRADPPSGDDLMLSVAPLEGDVLAEGIPWMLKRQQAEIEASQAQNPLSSNDIDAAADGSYLLDGSNALLARNNKLAEKLQPQWLKNLSPTQETVFAHLEQAQEKSAARLAPLFEQIPSLATFARDRMEQAIKKLYPTAQVDADQLMVQVRTRTHVNNGRKTSSQTPFEKNSRLSLTDLALKNPTAFPAGESATFTQTTLTLALTDKQGNPVLGTDGKPVVLDTDTLKTLVNTADVGGEYTRLLKKELAPDADSGAAAERREAWKTHQLSLMEKETYLAELNPDAFKAEARDDTTRKRGAQWVTTIMDHPDPASRPQVDGQTIVANTLVQRGLPVQGVMVIGNGKDPERVLYTPNAPDGITFREVPSQAALNTLLNQKEWLLYTANRKSPVSKDDVSNAQDALRQYAFDLSRNPVASIDLATKALKLTGDTSTLEPMAGNTLDALYKQQVQLLVDKADHQSVSSAEVAEQSRTNKIHFGIEVASIFLDLVPIVGKGVSTGVRLGKAGVTALRANARLLPKLIKNPALGRAIYADFATAGTGIPLVRTAPLRPVAKAPLTVVEPVPRTTPRALHVVDDIPPALPSTSTGLVSPATSTSNVVATPLRDLSAYAVPNTVIQGSPLRPDGTYNVGDNFYVRFTDSTSENKVYQIDSAFHARNGQVNIIDPNAASTAPKSSRIKASLQSAGNGEWRLSQLPGAKRHRGRIAPPENQHYMDRVLSGVAARDFDGNPATTGQIRRWFRRDMDNFYNDLAANGMPARPSMPVMPINSTPESAIKDALAQPGVRGLVVGEIHHEPAAYQLVIDQMEELHKSGVTTIYVEGAPFVQGSPNIVDARLRASHKPYFGLHTYHPDFTGGPTLMDIIDEADLYGIRVIGLEHQHLTWRMDNHVTANLYTNTRGVETRLKEFNYHAAKTIDLTPPGEKFVAIVGRSHMNTDYGVPGLAELTGGVGVSVSPSLKGGSSIASQPLHTPQPLKLMRGSSIPENYGDIHIDYNIDALTV